MTALSGEEAHRFLDILETQQDLDELGKLSADWNGYGAEPISPAISEAAMRLLDGIPADVPFRRPQVVPMTKGRIQLEWNGPERSLELELTSPTRLEYLKVDGGREDEASIELPGQSAEAYALIRWIGGNQ